VWLRADSPSPAKQAGLFFVKFFERPALSLVRLNPNSSFREDLGKPQPKTSKTKPNPMKAITTLRFAVAGLFVALVKVTAPIAQTSLGR
jgi:hypothetical protein